MNHYLQLFLESAHAASIVPLASQATFAAMKAFGGYNMPLALVLAVAGGALGHAFNWWLGCLIKKNPISQKGLISEAQYARAERLFQKYGIFLLLVCWAPLFNFIVVAAGFLGVRPKTALPLIILGLAGHYGWMLI